MENRQFKRSTLVVLSLVGAALLVTYAVVIRGDSLKVEGLGVELETRPAQAAESSAKPLGPERSDLSAATTEEPPAVDHSLPPPPPADPLLAGLLAYWPLDRTTQDKSGNRRDLVSVGGIGYTEGRLGWALAFPRQDFGTYAKGVDDEVFDFGGNSFTIQVWVYYNTSAGEQVLIEKWDRGGWTFTKLAGQEYRFEARDFGRFTTGPINPRSNVWHQLIARRQGDSFSIFFDGAEIGNWPNQKGTIKNGSEVLRLGHRIDKNFGPNGRLDEVAIWNRALTTEEINRLWNSGNGRSIGGE